MAEEHNDLLGMTEAELVDCYDSKARHTDLGLGFIRDELDRRMVENETRAIGRLSRGMLLLTIMITSLTIVNLILVASSL